MSTKTLARPGGLSTLPNMAKAGRLLLACAVGACVAVAAAADGAVASMKVPALVHQSSPFEAQIEFDSGKGLAGKAVPFKVWATYEGEEEELLAAVKLERVSESLHFRVQDLVLERRGKVSLKVVVGGDAVATAQVVCLPGWVSLLPPLVTLTLSVVLKQVIVALLAGIFSGALLASYGNVVTAFLRTFDHYFVEAFVVDGHMSVVLFTFLLGGTIGLVQKSGGALGLANALKGLVCNKERGQWCTAALSGMIFFDDYSSILIVGNSLKTVMSLVHVAVEKFAWIVHSLGVVLASMSPVSSWVGLQIGYTTGVLDALGVCGHLDGFVLVLQSLPFRFFPLFYLCFILLVLFTGRDIGPMAAAEKRAAVAAAAGEDIQGLTGGAAAAAPSSGSSSGISGSSIGSGGGAGALDPKAGTPLRWYNAVVPFAAVVLVTVGGMVIDGMAKIEAGGNEIPMTPVNILSNCDSVAVLIWASAAGWVSAMGLVLAQKLLTLDEAMSVWMEGMKEVLEPQFVLVLAWGLGLIVADVGTAEFLSGGLKTGIPVSLLPVIISLLCFVTSYACGSTFGTMGILFPLVGPLAWSLSGGSEEVLCHCFGCILGGSIFGNLCSPISDTTILTSSATGCGLSEHVATVTGYTLFIAMLSLLGDLAVGAGVFDAWTVLLLGTVVLYGTLIFFGKFPPEKLSNAKAI